MQEPGNPTTLLHETSDYFSPVLNKVEFEAQAHRGARTLASLDGKC